MQASVNRHGFSASVFGSGACAVDAKNVVPSAARTSGLLLASGLAMQMSILL